jgi:DNA-binding NtrC family response regulator
MNYNIILLDSDASHANLIKEHLKNYSEYTIHVFTNVEACMSQLKELKPAVIFLDAELKHDSQTMREETQIMFRLKVHAPFAEIILYSGEEKLEIMLEQVKKGAHGFALKSTVTKIKAEMLLLSAIRHYKLAKEARLYKKINIALVILVILIVTLAVLAYKFKIINDNVQGPFEGL